MSELASSPRVGVIGGSGLYSLLDKSELVDIDTPYGSPSAPVALGELEGREVAFLPRHGRKHEHPPHRVNYRANLWALEAVGATRTVSVSAVGSLEPSITAGTLVVPDQLIDRTQGREGTYFDGAGVGHASFADPYCAAGRHTALQTANDSGWTTVDGGTLVVIGGPRFSTRAESQWYQRQGWSIVGMTAMPEVALARELGMCFVPLCLVTDIDAGVAVGEGVTQEEVIAVLSDNVTRVRRLLTSLVPALPVGNDRDCLSLKPATM